MEITAVGYNKEVSTHIHAISVCPIFNLMHSLQKVFKFLRIHHKYVVLTGLDNMITWTPVAHLLALHVNASAFFTFIPVVQ